ncbi:MAG TPA: hypothetical protein VFE53_01230 [Mucilaginibacter sp.]|nr:hypothetical protein [Mucilaginibacter sp.]
MPNFVNERNHGHLGLLVKKHQQTRKVAGFIADNKSILQKGLDNNESFTKPVLTAQQEDDAYLRTKVDPIRHDTVTYNEQQKRIKSDPRYRGGDNGWTNLSEYEGKPLPGYK